MGIDPGTKIMGYGIIILKNNKIELIDVGNFDFSELKNHTLKLKAVYTSTIQLIEKHKPTVLAIETQFFGKNIQSMLKLARAQGATIVASATKNIPVFEYSPLKIKQSITGKGNSSKEQVASMLKNIMKIKNLPINNDATDALAIAVCHHFQNRFKSPNSKSYSNWKTFVKNNPNKIK